MKNPYCPDCNPRNHCPYCDPNRPKFDPWRESQCVLNKPLMMVIPPGGVHLSCPVHSDGHHIFGPSVTWMESKPEWNFTKRTCELDSTYRPIDYDSSRGRIIDFDSTRPYGTCTGDKF